MFLQNRVNRLKSNFLQYHQSIEVRFPLSKRVTSLSWSKLSCRRIQNPSTCPSIRVTIGQVDFSSGRGTSPTAIRTLPGEDTHISECSEQSDSKMEGAVNQAVSDVNDSIVDNVNKTSSQDPASAEGMVLAYGSLVVMAILPIFLGSFRSVKHQKEQQQKFETSGEKPETMSHRDAAMFPVISSCALFGLYLIFQIFSKEYINLLLTGYFFFLGVLALCHLTSPIISSLVPAAIPKTPYQIQFTSGEGDKTEDIINYTFNLHDIVCLICCSLIGVWYLLQKHWVANNLFAIAFAINAVELLHLNNIVTGCILLGGLFIYDIFWVFGTDVMVTVAKSFEAPIKLVFPQDLIELGLKAKKFAMLGLGDIVVPGIFIALLLRFDHSLGRKSYTYFYTTFFAYFMGLIATMLVMFVFNHAQPALLYLVPACIGTPLLVALVKGDLKKIFTYEDHPSALKEPQTEAQVDGKKDK